MRFPRQALPVGLLAHVATFLGQMQASVLAANRSLPDLDSNMQGQSLTVSI